jgi:hypothetical protein
MFSPGVIAVGVIIMLLAVIPLPKAWLETDTKQRPKLHPFWKRHHRND